MKIRVNDAVKVISGKDKGKISSVLKVLKTENKVVVEGVSIVKKHIKPGQASEKGGIIELEKPIDVSNVMYYNESLGKAVRIGYKFVDGKKIRICKKSGKTLDSVKGIKEVKETKETKEKSVEEVKKKTSKVNKAKEKSASKEETK